MSLSGNIRPRNHDASPDPRFPASCSLRSPAKNRKELLKLRPKGQGALSCFCVTRAAILLQMYGNSVELIRLEAEASLMARRAVSITAPLVTTQPDSRALACWKTEQGLDTL